MNITTYLYHYYELEKGPFLNISNQEYTKAKQILKAVKVGFNKNRPDDYLDKRLVLEQRLKEAFIAKGGKPTRNDPFYFSLGPCDWLKTWFANGAYIKLPLSIFEHSNCISFTYPDSMISYQLSETDSLKQYRKDCNGKVYLLNELEALIQGFGMPEETIWQSIKANHYDRYIEAQVWDDKFMKYLIDVKH